jgi:hypothetical protein
MPAGKVTGTNREVEGSLMRKRGFEDERAVEQLSRVVVASNKAENGRRFSLHPFERKIFVHALG